MGRMLRRWNACWYGPVSGRFFGNEPIARSLIEAGTDMNAMAGTIGAALQAAAASERNSVATIQFFFYTGANNGTVSGNFTTALQGAAVSTDEAVVRCLKHILMFTKNKQSASISLLHSQDRRASQASQLQESFRWTNRCRSKVRKEEN